MADRCVKPDDNLLKQIFTHLPETISIFLQNWDKCVFKAEFLSDSGYNYSACVVRLEAESEDLKTFPTIAALQQIAATVVPKLVPQTFQVGKAENLQGRIFDFSVTEFVEGDLLEDVWQQMSTEEQSSAVTEIVEALEKFHSILPSDKGVKEILEKTLREEEELKSSELPQSFGGPHTGILNNGLGLLGAMIERRKLKKPFCCMEPLVDSQGIRIRSSFEELGSTVINNSAIEKWPGEAVLCHNDLNPRNLILRSCVTSDGKSEYKLAGIIDWELAGFYPASYELSMQDTYLGNANRHVSFYMLLKQKMRNLVPRSSSQMILSQAMELVFESQQRLLLDGNNIGAHIRKRFIEYLMLELDDDPCIGWTRSPQAGPLLEYSSAAFQKLENDVIEEMVAKRKAKAT
ncbi:hypothetical protein LHYA1_G004531 [Lachnellula hyalina]|uniref:Aminoglycoside phosphotransferase domain-containing protein n=1 Tax=Lachnellula hyalina TaxID=1316788 RepID=A0A8H8R2K3_9HELO|nr:uncharacterized protein LHYA1_G004531 [Lachnellula hyalina]TVY26585.1 hypothetical protein LHYA1_G004531 [Lachnellula hyalina]